MQAQLQQHYLNIQKAIRGNIDTIQTLVEHANSLQTVIESISEGGGDHETKKAELKLEAEKINTSISALIEDTKNLFALYDEFIKAVVKSQ